MSEKIDLEKLVDVCAGPMDMVTLENEIGHYLLRKPEKLVITIDKIKGKENRYYTTIYMTEKDFKNDEWIKHSYITFRRKKHE